MATKRNSNLCIIRTVFGSNVEIHLTEAEVRELYDEVCRRSRDRMLGTIKAMVTLDQKSKKMPPMPNEEVSNETR